MIKAIQTKYKGYNFRSRLEARWAVFFDALGIEWDYEPEGFELPDGTRYLPDFRVKRQGGSIEWYEVKPNGDGEDPKMAAFARARKPRIRLSTPIVGAAVTHPSFQEGNIIDIEGAGKHLRVRIDFGARGKKWLVAAYANLRAPDGSAFTLSPLQQPRETFTTLRGDPYTHFIENMGMHDPMTLNAANAARSARFEFGQSGATA